MKWIHRTVAVAATTALVVGAAAPAASANGQHDTLYGDLNGDGFPDRAELVEISRPRTTAASSWSWATPWTVTAPRCSTPTRSLAAAPVTARTWASSWIWAATTWWSWSWLVRRPPAERPIRPSGAA